MTCLIPRLCMRYSSSCPRAPPSPSLCRRLVRYFLRRALALLCRLPRDHPAPRRRPLASRAGVFVRKITPCVVAVGRCLAEPVSFQCDVHKLSVSGPSPPASPSLLASTRHLTARALSARPLAARSVTVRARGLGLGLGLG
ncbi:hypothetical protein, conserved in T. vivax, (fragment), partial [Trypanosoma vivax Y486]